MSGWGWGVKWFQGFLIATLLWIKTFIHIAQANIEAKYYCKSPFLFEVKL